MTLNCRISIKNDIYFGTECNKCGGRVRARGRGAALGFGAVEAMEGDC